LIDLPPRRFVDIGHYQALKDSIKAGEEFLGTAVIGLDTTQRDEAKWDNVKVTLISSLVLAALGIAFILYLTHTVIITPVDYSVVIAQQVATGDLSAEVEAKSNDEMGQLLKAFQEMTANLRALIGQTQRSGIQITSSVTEIAASGKELEATVTEQAASTNEVVATAKEISATSQELVQTMNDVSNMADVAVVSADNGQQGLVSMESTMRQMEEATQSISSKLAVINEKAANITSVVTTITKVADQTNLLSLNAAIEAEKAGEYGVGFAVVAREVRRLADQTAVATLDIEQTVKEMRSAVAAGVMSMDKFSEEVRQGVDVVRNVGTQLAQIIEQVQALTPRFESVLEGMGAQAQGAQQISESMIQLNEGPTDGRLAARDQSRPRPTHLCLPRPARRNSPLQSRLKKRHHSTMPDSRPPTERSAAISYIEALLCERIGWDSPVLTTRAMDRAIKQRMDACGLADLSAYLVLLQQSAAELQELMEHLRVPETWFFRDQEPFALLGNHARSQWLLSADPVRLLSVPSSSSQPVSSTTRPKYSRPWAWAPWTQSTPPWSRQTDRL